MNDTNQKKVLIISYAFPPVGGGGVQRVLKFTKYLSLYGWTPIVLTVKNPSVPIHDSQYLLELSEDTKIVRAFSFEPGYKLKQNAWKKLTKENCDKPSPFKMLKSAFRGFVHLLLIPDPQIAWVPCAIYQGAKTVLRDKVDVIMVSAPPFSSFMIGFFISKLTNKPWIADFRDEWVPFYTKAYNFHKRKYGKKIIEYLERIVFNSADAIITATKSISDNYKKIYNRRDINTILNGYDKSEFSAIGIHGVEKSHKFSILYAGTVFEVTTARYFLKAIEELADEHKDIINDISIEFIGRIEDTEMGYFDSLKSKNIVQTIGYVPHNECIRKMKSSDLLLVLLDDIPGSERILTGKIFEYIAAEKTILLLAPPGELTMLVDEDKLGTIVHPHNLPKIKEEIIKLHSLWKKGKLESIKPKPEILDKYSRKKQTGHLSRILEKV